MVIRAAARVAPLEDRRHATTGNEARRGFALGYPWLPFTATRVTQMLKQRVNTGFAKVFTSVNT